MRRQRGGSGTVQLQRRTFARDDNRPANIQTQVDNSRRTQQRKYEQEAAAERKRKEKEKKRLGERPRPMEAFVSPGRVLGGSSLRRDLVQHQELVAGTDPGPNLMDQVDQAQYGGPQAPQHASNPDRHNYQEQMRAARERMQAEYSEELRRTREQEIAEEAVVEDTELQGRILAMDGNQPVNMEEAVVEDTELQDRTLAMDDNQSVNMEEPVVEDTELQGRTLSMNDNQPVNMQEQMENQPVSMQEQMENSRRALQLKYDQEAAENAPKVKEKLEQEAAEAERKRKEKEQKRWEEKMRRMEALVDFGRVLGDSTLQRDLVDHQEEIRAARERMQAEYSEALRRTREQGIAGMEN